MVFVVTYSRVPVDGPGEDEQHRQKEQNVRDLQRRDEPRVARSARFPLSVDALAAAGRGLLGEGGGKGGEEEEEEEGEAEDRLAGGAEEEGGERGGGHYYFGGSDKIRVVGVGDELVCVDWFELRSKLSGATTSKK